LVVRIPIPSRTLHLEFPPTTPPATRGTTVGFAGSQWPGMGRRRLPPHRSLHRTGHSDCPFDGGARGFMESTSLGGAIQFSGQSLLEPAVLLDSGCSAALQTQNRLFVRGANTSDGEGQRGIPRGEGELSMEHKAIPRSNAWRVSIRRERLIWSRVHEGGTRRASAAPTHQRNCRPHHPPFTFAPLLVV